MTNAASLRTLTLLLLITACAGGKSEAGPSSPEVVSSEMAAAAGPEPCAGTARSTARGPRRRVRQQPRQRLL